MYSPEPSLSISAIILRISSFFGSNPRALMATCKEREEAERKKRGGRKKGKEGGERGGKGGRIE